MKSLPPSLRQVERERESEVGGGWGGGGGGKERLGV